MRAIRCLMVLLFVSGATATFAASAPELERKKIVFVAGAGSHGWGAHEHYAGSLLMANALRSAKPGYTIEVVRNGWPTDDAIFDGVDAVVIYSDGGNDHPIISHQNKFAELIGKGVGLACIHYAVEVPKGELGNYFLDWIGGYFETYWSVNPHWNADFKELPDHPVTQGVRPFSIDDEWYYHMRFRDGMKGVTPILTAIPPESTLSRGDGPYTGNEHIRAEIGKPQHVAWVAERPDAGRGFGLTGGHFHDNWADDNFRRIVLNAIVWIAGGEIPEGGIQSAKPTRADLDANQDEPKPLKCWFGFRCVSE